jgi:ABC-2 type transport system permease protein
VTPRLFLHATGLQARKLMSYRTNFWLNAVVSFFVELAVAYFLWVAIFRETGREEIGGFSLEAMIVYYLAAILLGKVVRGEERDLSISTDIYEGGLTRYLLYPTSYFGFKYAEHLGSLLPAFVELVVFGAIGLYVVDFPPDVHITPATIAMAAVSVAVANLLHFLLIYPLQGVAFWADNVWSLNVMFRFASQMLGGLFLPLTLFPEWARALLDLLPFKYLFFVPTTTLMGKVPPGEWAVGIAISLGWCAALALVARVVWRRGRLVYTGVGI